MHTDIQNRGWVERLPAAARPFAILGRFDRPIGIWLLLLPGWLSIALGSEQVFARWDLYVLFAIGAAAMRAAGCVVNDLWDRDFDKKVERTRLRPLACGVLSKRQAGAFLIILLLIGFLVLIQMNGLTIFLGVLSLPLILVYPLMKRVTWWPQAFLGLTFNFGALMGWSAAAGELAWPALLLYAGGVFWTLGYDTVYAHQDKEDDALAGVKSTALRLGKYSRPAVSLFYMMQTFLWGAALVLAGGFQGMFVLLPVVIHLIWQMRVWEPEDAGSCLRVFRSNRDLGLLFFGAIIVVRLLA